MPGTTMREREQLVRSGLRAVSEGDLEAIVGMTGPDAEYELVGMAWAGQAGEALVELGAPLAPITDRAKLGRLDTRAHERLEPVRVPFTSSWAEDSQGVSPRHAEATS